MNRDFCDLYLIYDYICRVDFKYINSNYAMSTIIVSCIIC